MLRVIAALLAGLLLCAQTPMLPGFPPGTFQNRAALDAAPSGACSEATTFLARTSGLDATHQTAYTTMICGLVTDGLWTGIDALYILATDTTTNANLNLKSTSFGLTQVGGVSFTADQGYTGNGTTGYSDTGYASSTAGGSYTQNSASFGVYIRNNRTSGFTFTAISNDISATGAARWVPNYNTISGNYNINDAGFQDAPATTSQGFWGISRTGASATAAYRNASGTAIQTNTVASTGLSTTSFYIGAGRTPAAVDFSTDQIAAAFIARGLSSAEWVTLQGRINAYMTTVGANVY
jgi:hypothetical protein